MGSGRLVGRVCVVAGVKGDMGEAIAKRFAEEGGIVVGIDRQSHAIGALALTADLSDEAVVEQAHARVANESGRLDVVYNNAGPIDPDDLSALDMTLATWNGVIASILTVTWLSCKHAAPFMGKQATAGSINTARTRPALGASAFAMIRAASSSRGIPHIGTGSMSQVMPSGAVLRQISW